ncbi:MAG TPA: GAF domain-containing protein [Acetobacteraceae bacterium]|nr:GAF domain-containing protein [Acetobacteraceae bacterium]
MSELSFAESDRLAELAQLAILDTPAEPEFDRVVELARVLFDTPISAISLIDRDRQWFKAQAGLKARETPREQSFCQHAMQNDEIFVVPDASLDPRFATNPLVLGDPHIRFYAGAPLHGPSGQSLGAVCVISPQARPEFSESDHRKLEVLARIVSTGIGLRASARKAHRLVAEKDFELREAHYRIRNSLEYANLLAEIKTDELSTEKLSALAMAAWKQYEEAGGILNIAIKSLRSRMPAEDYRDLLAHMPGFGL